MLRIRTQLQSLAEDIRLANLLKRVAEYDPGLASDVWLSAMMMGYNFAVGVVKKVFPR